jgi:hypothetical protein
MRIRLSDLATPLALLSIVIFFQTSAIGATRRSSALNKIASAYMAVPLSFAMAGTARPWRGVNALVLSATVDSSPLVALCGCESATCATRRAQGRDDQCGKSRLFGATHIGSVAYRVLGLD